MEEKASGQKIKPVTLEVQSIKTTITIDIIGGKKDGEKRT